MPLNRSTRRSVAVRSLLLAAVSLCLGFVLLCASPAIAQHGGGGGAHGMAGGGGMGSMPGYRGMRPDALNQPTSQPMSQSREQSRERSHMGPQLGLGGRWWDEHKTVKKLELNPDQQRRMDSIFEANRPALTNLYANLQREQAHLAALPPGDLQDETKVFAAIDRVSQARTDLEKEYAHTMLQIRQQLAPQQLQALDHEIATTH